MDCARNIITANFSGGGTSATTAPLWQWDYGQVLCITGIDLPAAFEVHFSTNRMGGVSTVAVGADGQVTIPNDLLTIGKNLNAWIYLSDAQGEGETEYSITIPVKPRPMPETYDAEVTGEFDDVVRQVGEYAETAQTAADNAGASATAAAASASGAAASASAAETAKTAAETAQGNAEDAQAAAETAAQTATEKAQQTAQDAAQAAQSKADAESAAGRAEAAETGAESAKTDAETAAQGAAASASTATEKANLAGQAASAAAQSAMAAAQSAASIEGDVQTATQKAAEATAAAGQAVAAKDAAVTAQQGAETAATNAGQSASTATIKAAEAAQSASGAAQSKTDAEAAATRAEQAAATLTVDSALSDTSVNPVQNKVITGEVTQLKNALNDHIFSIETPTMIDGSYINSVGTVGSNASFALSDYIKVKNVYAVYSAMAQGYAIYYFTETKNKISLQNVSNETFVANVVKLEIPENAYYFRFNNYKPTLATAGCYILKSIPKVNANSIIDLNSNLNATKETALNVYSPTWTNGIFINSSTGDQGSSKAFKATGFIDISGYKKLFVKSKSGNSNIGFAFYDQAQVYISGVETVIQEYWSVDIPYNAYYVRVCTQLDNVGAVCAFGKKDLPDPHFIHEYNFSFTDEKYINRTNGNEITITGNSASDYVEIYRGAEKIVITTANAINKIIGGAFYNANKEFVSGIVLYTVGTVLETKSFNVPKAARYFRVTCLTGSKAYASAYTPINLSLEYDNAENLGLLPYVSAKLICVGDSLTAGDFYPKGTNTSAGDTQKNYPYFLSRILNVPITNAGKSGATALSWWSEVYPNINFANHDTMILWLGTNGGLTDTLNTDVDPYDDYNDYAATNTGTYCKIIEAFIDQSNGGKVFLVNVGNETTDSVITKIGEKYSLPIFDITYMLRSYSPELFNTNVVHRNTYGNLMIADYFHKKMGEWWANNISDMDFCFHTKENPLT